MNDKIQIYLGNGLFSQADRHFNTYIYSNLMSELRERNIADKVSIYVPQFNDEINDKTKCADSKMIYKADNEMLDKSDILLALLDGSDLGLATEVGRFAYLCEKNPLKSILGLYSDIRQGGVTTDKINMLKNHVAESQFSYINLYTIGAVKSVGEVYNKVDVFINAVVDKVTSLIEVKNNEKNK